MKCKSSVPFTEHRGVHVYYSEITPTLFEQREAKYVIYML